MHNVVRIDNKKKKFIIPFLAGEYFEEFLKLISQIVDLKRYEVKIKIFNNKEYIVLEFTAENSSRVKAKIKRFHYNFLRKKLYNPQLPPPSIPNIQYYLVLGIIMTETMIWQCMKEWTRALYKKDPKNVFVAETFSVFEKDFYNDPFIIRKFEVIVDDKCSKGKNLAEAEFYNFLGKFCDKHRLFFEK